MNNSHLSIDRVREVVREINYKNRYIDIEYIEERKLIQFSCGYSEQDSSNDWNSELNYVPTDTSADLEYGFTWVNPQWWISIEEFRKDGDVIKTIYEFLVGHEIHEAGEWFKYGNDKPFFPDHP